MRLNPIFNLPIILFSFPLLALGILVIYSSSTQLAFNQLFFALMGLILYILICQFDYRYLKSLTTPLYIINIALLLIVFLIGIETRGSVRWIPLGFFNVQPSEFTKPVLILLLANFWSTRLPSWRNIFLSLMLVCPAAILVFRQPDLGSTLTLVAIWAGILFAAKVSPKKIMTLILLIILAAPLSWFMLHDYQKQRIYGFISPSLDPLGMGYSMIQSTISVGSGELLGRGLGRGTQSRLQFLPEYRTDFIFASMAEELGFIGSLLILVLYLLLIAYCIRVAERSDDSFGYLILFGIVSMLLFQAFVNIGMNIGILPITGITLPLLSYGGSSLVATFICLALAASVAGFRKKRFDNDPA